MLEQVLYMCECCKVQYKEKEKAMACERSHRKNTIIKDFKYHAMSAYPDRVLISFENGENIWYKR